MGTALHRTALTWLAVLVAATAVVAAASRVVAQPPASATPAAARTPVGPAPGRGVGTGSSPAGAPTGPALEITRDDNGATLHATVGQQVTIRLGADFDWPVSYDPPGILLAVPGVNALVRGVQGILQAQRAGTVQISAQGRPRCQAGQACSQLIVAFRATVVVDAATGGGTSGGVTRKPATTAGTRTAAPATAARAPRPTGVALPNTGAAARRSGPPIWLAGLLAALAFSAALGAVALLTRRCT